jgi:probable HAF family extracellular repeat protein
MRRILWVAILFGLVAGIAGADYLCKQLDVPGSTSTQVWQINNVGQVAASSDVGGQIYSSGTWTLLPAPPASSGFTLSDLQVFGINDSGQITGFAGTASGPERGFLLTGTTYDFFDYLPGTYDSTQPRALSNSGIVTGYAFDSAGAIGPAFVYNPSGASGYPAGFTDIVPVLGSESSIFTIPGAMNNAGQFVGSGVFTSAGTYAFVYDPAATPPLSLFRIAGRPTAARGINDNGQVVGFTTDATGASVGFLLTSAGYQIITCLGAYAAAGLFPESINNDGVISGNAEDSASVFHGFVAYPNVVLPVTSVGGAFVFDVAVAPNTPVFLDPAPAVGYRYATGEGDPAFVSVRLPIGVGDNIYSVIVLGHAFTVPAGQLFDFPQNGFAGGVGAFEVVGIEPSANLDPSDPRAFVTEVTFAAAGRFTGTMTPMTIAGEIADLQANASDIGPGKSLAAKASAAAAHYSTGNVNDTCAVLAAFIAEANAQTGKKLSTALASALIAEAHAIRSAVGCR